MKVFRNFSSNIKFVWPRQIFRIFLCGWCVCAADEASALLPSRSESLLRTLLTPDYDWVAQPTEWASACSVLACWWADGLFKVVSSLS